MAYVAYITGATTTVVAAPPSFSGYLTYLCFHLVPLIIIDIRHIGSHRDDDNMGHRTTNRIIDNKIELYTHINKGERKKMFVYHNMA